MSGKGKWELNSTPTIGAAMEGLRPISADELIAHIADSKERGLGSLAAHFNPAEASVVRDDTLQHLGIKDEIFQGAVLNVGSTIAPAFAPSKGGQPDQRYNKARESHEMLNPAGAQQGQREQSSHADRSMSHGSEHGNESAAFQEHLRQQRQHSNNRGHER